MAGETGGLDIDEVLLPRLDKLEGETIGCDIVVMGCGGWNIEEGVMSILVSFRRAVAGTCEGAVATPPTRPLSAVLLVKESVRGRKLRVRAKTFR